MAENKRYTINMTNYPKVFRDTPFWNDFQSYLGKKEGSTINFNGRDMSRAEYNIIVSKRDIALWTGNGGQSRGMKPHRFWKVSTIKNYFGVSGNAKNLYNSFNSLFDEFMSLIEELKKASNSKKEIFITN